MASGPSKRRMGAGRQRFVAGLVVAALSACGNRSANDNRPPRPSLAASGEVIARVGDAPITKDIVLAIARARRVTPAVALDMAIRDAVFAQEAIDRGLDVPHARDVDAALVRSLAATFREEAKAEGPITEAEVNERSKAHYYWVARPESWVTVHAVVRVAEDAGEAKWQAAQKLAQKIHDAVAPAVAEQRDTWAATVQQDPLAAAFFQAANQVDKEGLEVVIQPLPGVATDAFTVQPEVISDNKVTARRDPIDPEFVKGAAKLEHRGDLSPPVRSGSGWHVILLVDRVPPSMLSLDERRAIFEDDIYDVRANKLTTDLVAKLHQATPTETTLNADALLALIHVGDEALEAAQVGP